MKKMIADMRENRTPHERRQFAMRIAGLITAVLFVVWVTTLGVRLAVTGSSDLQATGANTAAILTAVQQASTTLGY